MGQSAVKRCGILAEMRGAREVAQIRLLFDRGCERVGSSLVAQSRSAGLRYFGKRWAASSSA